MLTSGGGASRSAGNGAHDASPTRTDDRNRGAATNRISFEANIIQPAPAPVLRPTPDPSLAAPNAASGSFAPNHSGADAVAKGAPLPDPLDDLDEGLAGRVRDPAGDTAMRPLAEDPDGRSAALSPPPVQTVPAERSFLPDAPAASDQPPTLTTRPDRPAPAATPQVKVSPEEEARMLKRAADFLNQNDIASARLIYKYLAERGSTVAADIYKRVQSRESGNSSSR